MGHNMSPVNFASVSWQTALEYLHNVVQQSFEGDVNVKIKQLLQIISFLIYSCRIAVATDQNVPFMML